MQFKGTFQIAEFSNFETGSKVILREFRNSSKAMFFSAIALGLVEFAEYIPVLTGDTRAQLVEVIRVLEQKIKRTGVASADFNIDTEQLTSSLQDTGGKTPVSPIGDKEYKRAYEWADSGEKYKSRVQWRDLVAQYGHDGDSSIDTAFSWSANATTGLYTFFFGIENSYFRTVLESYASDLLEVFDDLVAKKFLKVEVEYTAPPNTNVSLLTFLETDLDGLMNGLIDKGLKKGTGRANHLQSFDRF